MSRLFATIMASLVFIGLGLHSLAIQQDALSNESLTGANADALNLTTNVSTDTTLILGNALPRLFVIVILVVFIGYLLLNR